ncbi:MULTISPECIES: hypothetical protein [Paraburkholderia]|uniref:hypothetical protein n=1 Tax=Paraburkholderia TaxID=1822464 RepID=UPI0022514F3A|nr:MULTISPECIES: hypothetical protein [Paraburkholderia]MCX4161760.1 hypothetical protein [Paraburkholderia megapolitana]MDN7157257.1 hypothetical protein [Paraburkholderia sp. CHISQ3]MDQ6494302.1 hypothetical protein [Paraburkholderia megapolitana]
MDPKPLFDEEEPLKPEPLFGDTGSATVTPLPLEFPDAPAAAPQSSTQPQTSQAPQVAALDLSGTPDPAPARSFAPDLALDLGPDTPTPAPVTASPMTATASAAIPIDEHPSIAQAMVRGTEKFPDVMRDYGYLVRNNLNRIVPLDFRTLTDFGSDTLSRAADLIGQVVKVSQSLHDLGAEDLIKDILDRAGNAGKHKSMLNLLVSHTFDPQAAMLQLTDIAQAIRQSLTQVDTIDDLLSRVRMTLTVETATIGIVDDMADRGTMGDMLARKASAMTTSLQEVDMAIRQAANIRRQAEEWVMRCDEVRTLTLPAMGFRSSLG